MLLPALLLTLALSAHADCKSTPGSPASAGSCSLDENADAGAAMNSPDWSMRGFELYSWKSAGHWHFALVRGSGRLVELQDVRSADVGDEPALVTRLSTIPRGSQLSWNTHSVTGLDLKLPPRKLCDRIRARCRKLGLALQ
jgi:hypothetical protein